MPYSALEVRANGAYPSAMDDSSPLPPPGWLEALAESEAQLAAGQTVPSEPIMQRLRETIARLDEGKQALREGRMLDHETVVAAFNRLTATGR
jgi:hypothetical protein